MVIIALTDIHDAFDEVDRILNSERNYDLIVIGGDLTTHGTPEAAEDAIRKIMKHDRPILAVAGNMDPVAADDVFTGLGVSINARGVIVDTVGFCGVSGAQFSPLHTPYEISEEEIALRAQNGWRQLEKATCRIFVPHVPPYGTALDRIRTGAHVGSTSVRRFIEGYSPEVAICGHIHESRGVDILGSTRVINCGPASRGFYGVVSVGASITVETRELRGTRS